jgi:GTPase SAR1 family protein
MFFGGMKLIFEYIKNYFQSSKFTSNVNQIRVDEDIVEFDNKIVLNNDELSENIKSLEIESQDRLEESSNEFEVNVEMVNVSKHLSKMMKTLNWFIDEVYPLIYIETKDITLITNYLEEYFLNKDRTCYVIQGTKKLGEKMLECKEQSILIVPQQGNNKLNLDYCYNEARKCNMTIIVIDNKLHNSSNTNIPVIVDESMDVDEIEEKIFDVVNLYNERKDKVDKLTIEATYVNKLANEVVGLGIENIYNILSIIIQNNLFNDEGLELANKIIKYNDESEIVNNDDFLSKVKIENVNIIGCDILKNYFFDYNNYFRKVIVVGIPGCGKTRFAHYIANHYKLDLYKWDNTKIYGKWLGESGKNLKRVFEFLKQKSPCVLLFDEIEKGIGSTDAASHETRREIFGEILYWLSESDSKIIVIATCNDIDQLPAELLRRGRFEKFFIDYPNDEERKKMIDYYWGKHFDKNLSEPDLARLTIISKNFTGAELEECFMMIRGKKDYSNIKNDHNLIFSRLYDEIENYKDYIGYSTHYTRNKQIREKCNKLLRASLDGGVEIIRN